MTNPRYNAKMNLHCLLFCDAHQSEPGVWCLAKRRHLHLPQLQLCFKSPPCSVHVSDGMALFLKLQVKRIQLAHDVTQKCCVFHGPENDMPTHRKCIVGVVLLWWCLWYTGTPTLIVKRFCHAGLGQFIHRMWPTALRLTRAVDGLLNHAASAASKLAEVDLNKWIDALVPYASCHALRLLIGDDRICYTFFVLHIYICK